MEDPNLIAWLFPAESEHNSQHTWAAIRMNTSGYLPQGETKSDYRSRESTVSLEDEEDQAVSYPRLPLVFNSELKGGQGLVFGTDAKRCDIVLPNLQQISRRHCCLTFDAERRLILRDFSKHGTIVTYDNKGRGLRRHFTWILGGHNVPRETERIVIEIHRISFQIIVSTHEAYPDLYNANVDRFLQKANANDELPLGVLRIQSTSTTAAPSGARTPNQDPIRLKQETLGEGAFAVVRRFWDVSTGFEYAYKEPRNKKNFDREMWEREVGIMRQISHDNVVKLVDSILMPSPRLILEYVPFGSLNDHTDISVEDCVKILCQGLSVLMDLHGRKVPIVHRDIKPGNILVQSRDPLQIKLADFGLSRASNDLITHCGTPLYIAPEVHGKGSYTPAVDIWSLGVLVFELAYGLPDPKKYRERRWCEKIIEEVNDWDSEDLIDFLSTAMIVMDPKQRHSARDCYEGASQLRISSRRRCLTPTPTSYSEGYGETVVYHPAEGQEIRDQTLPRSDAPPESCTPTSPPTRKRSTRPSTSTSPSPSKRRHTKNHKKAAAASSSSHPQREESEPVTSLFGKRWLEDPRCVGSAVAAMGQSDWSSWGNWETEPSGRHIPRSIPEPVDVHNNDYDRHLIEGGDAFAQDSYPVNTVAQGGGEGAWTDSQEDMAARLLYAIREDDRL